MGVTASAKPDQHTNVNAALEREAGAVLQELRPALAAILEGLRPPVRRAAELQRLLNLDKKLSWSVFNAATAPDARALPSLLPGRRAMERFFGAAELHGVFPDAIGRARAAFRTFEESVERHAGSRDAFQTMVAELGAGTDSAGTDLRHKRAAFRALSLLWGRQARLVASTMILHPSTSPGLLDEVLIGGTVGHRRTRLGVPLHTMAHRWRVLGPGDPAELSPAQPVDPRETGPDAVGLLRDFCSQPLPEFQLRVSEQGYRSHELVGNGLGTSGEVSYFTGEVSRAVAAPPGSVPGSSVWLFKTVEFPVEVYIGDILVHANVWGPRLPDVDVYKLPLDRSTEFRDADLLPLAERAEYLGVGIDAARTPLLPRYTDVLSYAIERMGWNAADFRVFRCRVDYPVLYSRIRMTLR